jgi:arylsulfatase
MKRWISILLCLACLPFAFGTERDEKPPDIVLILADDLGYSDLGCYGSEIRTPVLDGLAEQGLRFSQFYNAARCCPSRASLLTGLYPHQAGIGHITYDAGKPGYHGDLNKASPTIATVLKESVYFTAMSGKWHVTSHTEPDSARANWPCQRGFDEFFGTLPGHGSFWDPKGLMRNNTPIYPPKGFFYTDAIADYAVQFIRKAAAQKKPLFLYVAFTAPHYPLHAREKTIESYDGVYDDGWDVIRKRRFEKLKKIGLIKTDAKLAPRDPASIPWEDEPHKAWQAHRMQVYAAMVTEMDTAIGRIVEALTATGKLENTLLIFLSDNGGSNEGHLHNTIERMKQPWTSSMIPENAPDGTPVRAGDWPGEKLGGPATYGSYGPRWANVSNTPFRRHKSWVHEGGIATPCIIHWPAQIKIPRITHQPAHLIDMMPTFAEVGSTKRPTTEGSSLIPEFTGKTIGDRAFGWEHEGNRAFRMGNWKIVSEFPGTWKTMYPYQNQGHWELYNLETDRSELNDLVGKHPEKLNELATAYEKWAKRVGVVAWENLERKRE